MANTKKTNTAATCPFCEEPLADLDPGEVIVPWHPPAHQKCGLRAIAGSVGHQRKTCHCYVPGADCGDDPALSVRDNARAAWDYYVAMQDLVAGRQDFNE